MTDAAGKPLEGSKSIEFNIYDAASGGNLLWGPQTFGDVILSNGQFNVILGPADSGSRSITDAFTSNNRYIGVKVGGSAITPRQQILSTPFAINANIATNLSKKTLWQQNKLTTTLTSEIEDIEDLRFNSLEIGKTYRLTLSVDLEVGGGHAGVRVMHNGNTISFLYHTGHETNGEYMWTGNSVVFTASSTTLQFNLEGSGTIYLRNRQTYATLEELPYHEQTTQWN